jgi:hypothetical protein
LEDEFAKRLDHFFVPGCIRRHGAVGKGISVNPVSAQVFEHSPDNTFSGANATGETDDVFVSPFFQ